MMYELLYIVPTQFADTEIDGVRTKIVGVIEANGGKVVRNESLGKLRLAYPIKNMRHGTYVLAYFEAETKAVANIDRLLRLADEVLRHTILVAKPGAETKTYQISSYVAPLSEEAREAAAPAAPARRGAAPARAAATSAAPMKAEEAAMSMEELDKKLDEILDADVTA